MAIATLPLSELDGSNGLLFSGVDVNDVTGFSVSSAGDVNDDGIEDLLIGAVGVDPTEGDDLTEADFFGVTYVLFGDEEIGDRNPFDLETLDGQDGFVITTSIPGGLLGASVSSAGDFNSDGVDDLIISRPGNATGGLPRVTDAVLLLGSSNIGDDGTIDIDNLLLQEGFAFQGDGSTAISALDSAGDVNGDGIGDVIIGDAGTPFLLTSTPPGRAGRAFLIFGRNNTASLGDVLDLTALNAATGVELIGAETDDFAGFSVSGLGDINGDGLDDVIIGAPTDQNAIADALEVPGRAYVVFGNRNLDSGGSISLATLSGDDGFIINGETGQSLIGEINDLAGAAVSGAGDVNGDGFNDLIIGAPRANPAETAIAVGAAYVIFGGPNVGASGDINLADLDGADGFVIDNIVSPESIGLSDLGLAVSGGRDVNGDGLDDLLIGNPSAAGSGITYVVYGDEDLGTTGRFNLANLNGENGFAIVGGMADAENLGTSLALTDLNGDDLADVVLGAPEFPPTLDVNVPPGETYVVFGGTAATGQFNLETGDAGDNQLIGIRGADLLEGLEGADLLGGRAGDDVLLGGAGDDVLKGHRGEDIVVGGTGDDRVVGNRGEDSLLGGEGNDLVKGNQQSDRMAGGSGEDSLRGQGGRDFLDGGTENDRLVGGAGGDRFILRIGDGSDIINDFGRGRDALLLVDGLTFDQLAIATSGSTTEIRVATTNELLATVRGPGANNITEADFIEQDAFTVF